MNRRLLTFGFFLFIFLILGCGVSSPSTGQPLDNNASIKDFEFVTLNAPGVMEISQGADESLEMVGDTNVISSITAAVADHTLVISSEKDLPTNSSIIYKLAVKNLTGVLLNSFGVVKIPNFESDVFELTINGSGRMNLGDIKTTDLKLVIKGSGNIEADSVASTNLVVSSADAGNVTIRAGNTADLILELGSGLFLGADLKSSNVTINLNGSGSAQVWAVEKLDVTINGSGKVTYFGEPTMNMSVSGGGQLTGGGNK